ncbi:transcriptional regulator, TetR family [Filimonas lacunae]|uniref:Transcriptional regulator, TetR family n=1 Tax=Filimonas lacunae TaxID=477680 RepID=A0A173MFD1_9BACT|nr:TetR/AcrR family transcriptional regulator [Filimonas lacunae]BAV06207.1 transcriptional regulator, TetR family [Filimonas lacunae]SIT25272.1 transcriptional regulator, TetR family [Filimonas lacunae]
MSKAEATRTFIIEKTAPVFNKKGYAGTSLADLTEATGLTKGALYGNFKNKDEIALAAFDYNQRLVKTGLAHINSKSAIEKLLAIPQFFKSNFAALAANGGCPVLNTAVEADDNQPALKEKVNEAIHLWKQQYESLIQAGIDAGEIKPGVHPGSYANIFLALFEGSVMLSKVTGDLSFFNDAMNRTTQIIKTELQM